MGEVGIEENIKATFYFNIYIYIYKWVKRNKEISAKLAKLVVKEVIFLCSFLPIYINVTMITYITLALLL